MPKDNTSITKSTKAKFKPRLAGYIAVALLGVLIGAFVNHLYETNQKCGVDSEKLAQCKEKEQQELKQKADYKKSVTAVGRFGGLTEAGKLKLILTTPEEIDGKTTGNNIESIEEVVVEPGQKVINYAGESEDLTSLAIGTYISVVYDSTNQDELKAVSIRIN